MIPAKILGCTIIFLLVTTALFSQESEFIRGRLYDAQNGEPVPFATIRVKGRALGVISNQDGGFRVPKRFEELGDTLLISCMGYERQIFRLSGLSPEHINIIRLRPGTLLLKEAVVTAKKKRSLSARAIVRRAIRAIPSNYPVHPFSTVGYYRDYQLKEADYLNLNEAILEVFDQGFKERDQTSTRVRIYEYRPNMDFDRDVEADKQYNYENWSKVIARAYLYNYGGNEFAILRVHDALRNYNVDSYDFVNKLESDLLNNHSFSKAEDSYYEDELLYQIEFEKRIKGFHANGTLYISKKDFAIYQMEYALYDNLKRKISGETNRNNSEKELIFEVLTEYKKKNNKMFLNYISFHNSFQLIRPPLFVVEEVLVDLPKRCFIVQFNNFVSGAFAVEKKNYDFKFKGQRIKFKRIETHDEYVELYADGTEKELYEMMHEIDITVRKKLDVKDLLDFQFEKIRDVEGNVINEPRYEEYQQFREYFVQETKTRVSLPLDTLYMKRDHPIFKDQPIAKPDNFKEYWMNTPLQKPKE